MNFLDDIRAEWIAMRKSLGEHIAYLEAGNKIHPIDRDPNEATTEFLGRLKQYRSDVRAGLFIFLRRASDALLSVAARIIARTAFLKSVRLLVAHNASNHTASCAALTIVSVGCVNGLSDARAYFQ